MPKYTKQELRDMAKRVVDGLNTADPGERTRAYAVIAKTAMLANMSVSKAERAIRNLAPSSV